jgi:hypothetical protein
VCPAQLFTFHKNCEHLLDLGHETVTRRRTTRRPTGEFCTSIPATSRAGGGQNGHGQSASSAIRTLSHGLGGKFGTTAALAQAVAAAWPTMSRQHRVVVCTGGEPPPAARPGRYCRVHERSSTSLSKPMELRCRLRHRLAVCQPDGRSAVASHPWRRAETRPPTTWPSTGRA